MVSVRTTHRWVTGAVLALAGLTACGGDEATLLGVVRTPPLEVAAIALPDVTSGGASMTMTAPTDGLLIVYFGYTSCPDVCPTTLADLRVALGDLDDGDRARVSVAMATVDPERDTGEVLSGYIQSFFPDGHALVSNDPPTLAEAMSTFGVAAEISPHEPGESYDVSHTAVTYVVDDTGTVVVEWPFGTKSEAITSDIELLLDQTKES